MVSPAEVRRSRRRGAAPELAPAESGERDERELQHDRDARRDRVDREHQDDREQQRGEQLRDRVDARHAASSTATGVAQRETPRAEGGEEPLVVGDGDHAAPVATVRRSSSRPARPRSERPARMSARRAAARAAGSRARSPTERRRFCPPDSVNGCAAARSARPSRSRRGPTIAATAASGSFSARGPTASSSRTVVARNWCSGAWKTEPMRGSSCRELPADRLAVRAVGEFGSRDDPARGGRQQSAQRERERRLAGAVRPGDRENLAGREARGRGPIAGCGPAPARSRGVRR